MPDESLYEILERKRNNEDVILKYAKEHDWEIGYQLYGNFVKSDLKNFIHDLLQRRVIWTIKGEHLQVSYNRQMEPFIDRFMKKYSLGYLSYPRSEGEDVYPKYLTIRFFDGVYIDNLLFAYNMEMQELTRFDITDLEANREFEDFKRDNQDWLKGRSR